jgi:hypothetical protein
MTDDPIIYTDGLSDNEISEYRIMCKQLETKYQGVIEDIKFDLQKFNSFKYYEMVSLRNNVKISNGNGNAQILFTTVIYTSPGEEAGINTYSEEQVYGFFRLKNDLGQVLIRRKRFSDKIYELFNRKEIKFKDNTQFSKSFYVLGDNSDLVQKALNSSFKKAIMEIKLKDFFIEILGNEVIIGNKKPVVLDTVLQFSAFTLRLNNV